MLKSLINKYFPKGVDEEQEEVSINYDSDEVSFNFSVEQRKAIHNKTTHGRLMAKWATLRMLEEQGEAKHTYFGFTIPAKTVVRLDDDTKQNLLGLPQNWQGSIKANIKSSSRQSNFVVDLKVADQGSNFSGYINIEGPTIKFGEERHLLTPEQFNIFAAKQIHDNSSKTEFDNLTYLYALQQSKRDGADLALGHFKNLKIKLPQSISVEVDIDQNGDLLLTPNVGQEASHKEMQKVLGQLQDATQSQSIRVGDEIIIFDDEKLAAVKEIISNRVISKSRIQEFLTNPTAFIDASLVDLDLGFSIRVHGATVFKHAYFGDIEESGIDWFDGNTGEQTIYDISQLTQHIDDIGQIEDFESRFNDSIKTQAEVIRFEGCDFDISQPDLVIEEIAQIKQNLIDGTNQNSGENRRCADTHVVDVDLLDTEVPSWIVQLNEKVNDVSYKGKLDWQNYKRQPFSHQDAGVRWILGLADNQDKRKKITGSILADDMGLGKTFMALAAIENLYRRAQLMELVQKPCLIVAPLSLLQNWQDEIEKTFYTSPFNDSVILQSNVDLALFKEGDIEIKNQVKQRDNIDDEDVFTPRYSLKVGKIFGNSRLDMPARLVITTYQTLRDYQFSLCLIDWGMVVFDEAQNIKNPNALQTRAAKGLKADFKLVTTGTPVENSLADLWCLMDTAYPGYLGSYQTFRETYITPILAAKGAEASQVRERIGADLRLTIGALMLRRLKEEQLDGLPQKYLHVGSPVENNNKDAFNSELQAIMTGEQKNKYDHILNGVQRQENVLTTLQDLKNVSLHPRLIENSTIEIPCDDAGLRSLLFESTKVESLIKILTQIKDKDEKAIIFVMNKQLQLFLSLSLGRYFALGFIPVINGDVKATAKNQSTVTRKSIIADFEAKAGFNLIIMSPIAAGVGLTVVGANHVIHFERHWNPAKEAQASDRVYRIGQVKDVHIYLPLLLHPECDSFDLNLHRLLGQKTQLKEAVITPEQVSSQELQICLNNSGVNDV